MLQLADSVANRPSGESAARELMHGSSRSAVPRQNELSLAAMPSSVCQLPWMGFLFAHTSGKMAGISMLADARA